MIDLSGILLEMFLSFAGCPLYLIKLIMSYVSSSLISILLNGGKIEPFHPSRSIRQGDPLSPYLFIMCMEMLGFLISQRCEENLWDPARSSRGGQAFSHLFFADNLVLFAKADCGIVLVFMSYRVKKST